MSESLLVDVRDNVGWLTLNRPERRNALDRETRSRLSASFGAFDADPDVRVVVLTGTGTAFCAGVDQKESGPAGVPLLGDTATPVAEPVASFSKPIIAAINGPAAGGGLELALACDIRIASETATFSLPEVRIGSIPGSGGTQRLLRAIPYAVAVRMLMTGDAISAAEAYRVGLVSELVPVAELTATAVSLAARIAANAPLSLIAVKKAIAAAGDGSLTAGLTTERALWALLSTTEDRDEGRQAFREHRPPRYSGK